MRTVNRLNAKQIANVRLPEGRDSILLNDGANLLLQVSQSAKGGYNKSWLFRYERDGKRHDLGLGPLHTFSLAEAREKARLLRQQIYAGVDPIESKRADERARELAQIKAQTFEQTALAFITAHEAKWKQGGGSREQWMQSLTDYAFPKLGKLLVADIDTAAVTACLEPIWRSKHETARRVRNRIEQILDYAKAKGLRGGDNPAAWTLLEHVLPQIKNKKHLESMPYSEAPAFVAELRGRSDLIARAVELCVLTATRANEVAGARWEEFNLNEATWDIPSQRMKAGKPHRVMLSPAAVALLRDLPRTGDYLFPLQSGRAPIHRNRLLRLLRDMGHKEITAHGFRSTFKSWASERTRYPSPAVEMCLAHTVGNEVERAYTSKVELIEQRRRLMSDWAAFCSRPVAEGKVLSLRRV
jgi:integrase